MNKSMIDSFHLYTFTFRQKSTIGINDILTAIAAMMRNPLWYSHGQKKGMATEKLIPSTSRTENPLRTEYVHTVWLKTK